MTYYVRHDLRFYNITEPSAQFYAAMRLIQRHPVSGLTTWALSLASLKDDEYDWRNRKEGLITLSRHPELQGILVACYCDGEDDKQWVEYAYHGRYEKIQAVATVTVAGSKVTKTVEYPATSLVSVAG